MRAKVLPVGFVYFPDIRDLDGDGNDELLVQVSTQPWLGRRSEQAFVVTMRDGRLIAHLTPFTFAKVSSIGGRRLIGIIKSGKQEEVAVGEWLPDGRWKVEKFGIKMHSYLTVAIGDWDGDGEDNTALVLDANEAKVFIFQKRLKGQWDRVKEIKVSRYAPCVSVLTVLQCKRTGLHVVILSSPPSKGSCRPIMAQETSPCQPQTKTATVQDPQNPN